MARTAPVAVSSVVIAASMPVALAGNWSRARLLGERLKVRVERRVDPQTAAEQRVDAGLLVVTQDVGAVEQVLLHRLGEVRAGRRPSGRALRLLGQRPLVAELLGLHRIASARPRRVARITCLNRARLRSGLRIGSYADGARTSPARNAPSTIVRSCTSLPKYVSAAAWMPYALLPKKIVFR